MGNSQKKYLDDQGREIKCHNCESTDRVRPTIQGFRCHECAKYESKVRRKILKRWGFILWNRFI